MQPASGQVLYTSGGTVKQLDRTLSFKYHCDLALIRQICQIDFVRLAVRRYFRSSDAYETIFCHKH